MMRTEEF